MSGPSTQVTTDHRPEPSAPAASGAPVRSPGWAAWAACGLLVVATLFVFWPAVHCGSVNFDDPDYVFANWHVIAGLTPASMRWALSTTAFFYIPLTRLSFLMDVSLWGIQPWGFHLTNIVLHAANAGLLLLLLVRVTGRLGAAALAAALFALHPLRVESVVWITERKDVLSLCLALLALHAWVNYVHRRSVWRYGAAAALYAAALLAKPQVLTLPLLLLLWDYWPLERGRWPQARQDLRRWGWLALEKAPLFLLTALTAVCTLVFQTQSGSVSSAAEAPLGFRVGNALVSVWRYVARLVRVDELAVFYPPPAGWSAGATIAAASALALVTALAIWQGRRRPWFVVGWLWFLVALAPVSGVVQSGPQAMADRYTYLSMIGLIIALVWSIPPLWLATPARRAFCAGVGLALVVTLSFFTRVQISSWRDSVTLWHHDLEVSGKSSIGLTNLGSALLLSGHADEAEEPFQAALRLNPRDPRAHANLGVLCTMRGQIPAAIDEFRESLREDPNNVGSLVGLTTVLLEIGRPAEAAAFAQRLTRLTPDDARGWLRSGNALARSGSPTQAEEAFNRAGELAPTLTGLALGRAELAASQGHFDEARRFYSAELAAHPDSAEAWFRAGEFLAEGGQHDQAIEDLRKALDLAPGNNEARINLGIELAAQGDTAGAIDEYRRVLERRPDDADAHLNLAAALADTGLIDEAVQHAGRAAALRPDMAEAQYDYGALLARAGQPQLAMEHLEAAAKLNPGDPDTVALLASLRLAQPAASGPAATSRAAPGAAPATRPAR